MSGAGCVAAFFALVALLAAGTAAAGEADRPRGTVADTAAAATAAATAGSDRRRAATSSPRRGQREASGAGRGVSTGAISATRTYSPDPKSLGLGCASGED
ncbi:MAG TPA: hypothetical protein VFY24_07850 [Azospira sp.]|nr:hypothetical protein [Azospira sp.]